MKTLLLTSAGMKVEKEILKILPKKANQTKIAHIITAAKGKNPLYLRRDKKRMLKVGFIVEDIDIKNKNKAKISKLLKDKDIIYVQGGDTFYLLKWVKKSGFDKIVKKLIKQGVIYIGVSAGSYIACPNIEMAAYQHHKRNINKLRRIKGLSLVPFLMAVHYEPNFKNMIKKAIIGSQYPVKILTDKQAILVKGNKVKLVGEGPEIKI